MPLSPRLAAWLRQHLEVVTLEGQVKNWSPRQRALVFPNSNGDIGRHSTFMEHLWRPLLAKAELRYRKPHSMHPTCATWALEGSEEKGIRRVPIQHLRDWMGQASIEETERYLHPELARHARTMDSLDAYVAGV